MEYLVVTPALSKFSVTALFTSFAVSTSEVMILIGDCSFLPHIGKSSLHLLGPKSNLDSAKIFRNYFWMRLCCSDKGERRIFIFRTGQEIWVLNQGNLGQFRLLRCILGEDVQLRPFFEGKRCIPPSSPYIRACRRNIFRWVAYIRRGATFDVSRYFTSLQSI